MLTDKGALDPWYQPRGVQWCGVHFSLKVDVLFSGVVSELLIGWKDLLQRSS